MSRTFAAIDYLVKDQGNVLTDQRQEQLASKLGVSFEVDCVEDGIWHPAEGILDEVLESASDQRILDWLKDFCSDASRPSFAASVLRCLGRNGRVGTGAWRADLVRSGLAMDRVEVREAAVQAAEIWGDSELIDVLGDHSETVPWLGRYISDVLDDLAGQTMFVARTVTRPKW